jgi:hypothetical protein
MSFYASYPPQLSGGGGGTAWGTITGTLSNQTDLQNALNTKANTNSPTFTPMITVQAGAFSGVILQQNSVSGLVKLMVNDATANLQLLPGGTSGVIFLGYLGGAGGIQAYTSIPLTLAGGNLSSADGDNVRGFGTDSTGALVTGNRWKDGLFGTSLRAPLHSDLDNTAADATAGGTVTVRGGNKTAGTGNGGDLNLQGGTSSGGAPGRVGIPVPAAPATSSSAGNTGNIAWDSGFIYVCTAANTWKRVAIATF